ncbi:unnamed protein product [Orchesella dallaii]|uniref:Uncharacterized protein n=1 Tax=Orchesella dallaii TaxID=48710 RepID=A0ABP1PN37_9HEXA
MVNVHSGTRAYSNGRVLYEIGTHTCTMQCTGALQNSHIHKFSLHPVCYSLSEELPCLFKLPTFAIRREDKERESRAERDKNNFSSVCCFYDGDGVIANWRCK